MTDRIEMVALTTLPVVREPTPLAPLVLGALEAEGLGVRQHDVLVIAQKLVSKAEGSFVDLAAVTPSERALGIAASTGKDPRLVEVILAESRDVVRVSGGHLITEHRLGFVCANAGVDRSNAGASDRAVLLPRDPDATARELRAAVHERHGVDVAVIVSDSHGRAFRNGAIGVAIGVSGLAPLHSYKGEADLDGRLLQTSEEAVADELASAASLLMGQGSEGRPVVLIRGFGGERCEGGYAGLVRDPARDLFR